jgi:hypothetical protein
LHKRLASETHLEDGEFLKVAVNREELLKLWGRTGIPVISKRRGQNYIHKKQKWIKSASR